MRAMVLRHTGRPLELEMRASPTPRAGEVLVRVAACAVCRTDLHVVDGDLGAAVRLPVVPGHQIVGHVAAVGTAVPSDGPSVGSRVGVTWLGQTCGVCAYCHTDRENLCDAARFTGCSFDGGFADHVVCDHRFCFAMPRTGDGTDDAASAVAAAPLLCAGIVGHRCFRMVGDADRIGLYGFGAAAHIVAQVAVYQGRRIYAFTRPGDHAGQAFARDLGVSWAGDSTQRPNEPLDAAIIFAPVGTLVPAALASVVKGGVVVCGGIHMSDIPAFPYALLWGERVLRSVANLTRADAREFLSLVASVPLRTHVAVYDLEAANEALRDLRGGRIEGAAVLRM